MYILFLAFWIILNGKITGEILLFGAAISAVVFYFTCRFMDYSLRKEWLLYRSAGMLLAYLGLLLKEIFVANFNVLKLIYSPLYDPEPGVVTFRTDLKTGLAKVLLANSITLTPGTVTVSLEGDLVQVHCLDMSFAEGIEECSFVKQLRRIESGWTEDRKDDV